MLYGVRQQVVYHLLHLCSVEPYFYILLLSVELYLYLFRLSVSQEQKIRFVKELYDIILLYLNLHHALLLLSEVEKLADKSFQLNAALVSGKYFGEYRRRDLRLFQNILQLSDDKRKRSSELVRNACKEAQFRLVQVFYVLQMLLFVSQ